MSDQHTLAAEAAQEIVDEMLTEKSALAVDVESTGWEIFYDPVLIRAWCRELQPPAMRRAFAMAKKVDELLELTVPGEYGEGEVELALLEQIVAAGEESHPHKGNQ